MAEFNGVVPALGQALTSRGYEALTPVQTSVLAPELQDADLLVSAQTGSGKTVAFGLAIAPTLLDGAERFTSSGTPLALVVAPTRELALQVKRELEWLYAPTGALVASCVGGMDMRTERRALQRGAHIVVGTPGRLRDHIEKRSLDLSDLRASVLDEADEMLDLGFRDDLEFILGSAPDTRRTLMFSATVPRSIANLAKTYQRNAVRLATTEEQKQHIDIEYRALAVSPKEKENAIINVLRFYEAKNAMVFCNTRATVNHLTARLNNRGFAVVALSGELSQNERTHALQALRDGRARVCVATDVAARGIDLPGLELVVHADLPTNSEILLHRSGRTGRAGRKGVCAIIVPHNNRRKADRLLGGAKITAEWANPPSADEVTRRDDQRIIESPVLTDPIENHETAFIGELLARHGAEQIAAAFVRQYRSGQSAPEEIEDAPAPQQKSGKSRQRDNFGNSVWFSLSVGRKQNAEPRWLLPMLCGAGGLNKNDIGAIRIQQTETFVELTNASVDQFTNAIGPHRKLEDTIGVTRLSSPPQLSDGGRQPYAGTKPAKSKPYAGGKPKRKFAKKSSGGDAAPASGGNGEAKPKPPKSGKSKNVGPDGKRVKFKRPKGDKPFRKKPRKPSE